MIENEIEEALNIADTKTRYEYVYDALCDYLDKEFRVNNYCDFIDNKCVAVREGKTDKFTRLAGKDCIGCCSSYDLGIGLSICNLRTCIHLGDKGCNTKCVSCKLYACKYLREKGIRFDIFKFPELKKVFSRKQIEVLHNNPFNLREDIIDRLLKVKRSKLPLWLFWMLNRGSIK